MKRTCLVLAVVLLAAPRLLVAQPQTNFSGTWKLASADPPVPAGRGGGGGGGVNGPYAATMLAQAPDTILLTQNASSITVQIGPSKILYTLDNQTTEVPPGDVMAFKSRAHWEKDGTLHLHYKQGMNWGRDVLTLSGTSLTLVRDLESGGASTTRTLKYMKTP